MNTPIPRIDQKWTHLFLTVLTGSILATVVVTMLVSGKIGAMQLAYWQIAAIYVVAIAACVLSGVKSLTNEGADDLAVAGTRFGKPVQHHNLFGKSF
jgi:hypothetical protein